MVGKREGEKGGKNVVGVLKKGGVPISTNCTEPTKKIKNKSLQSDIKMRVWRRVGFSDGPCS